MRTHSSRLLFAAALLLGAGSASAGTIPVGIPSVTLGENGASGDLASLGVLVQNPDGVTGSWSLTEDYSGGGWLVSDWTLSYDNDPFVTNNITVTNVSLVTQTFVATVLLPISPFGYNVHRGSVGVSTTDSNGDGVLTFASVVPTGLHQGTINGATQLELLDPIALNIASCGSIPGCTAVASQSIAYAPVGPGVATQIGLILQFNLSPGDSASLTSRYEIAPEPTTLTLALAGLAGLGVLGRRRN